MLFRSINFILENMLSNAIAYATCLNDRNPNKAKEHALQLFDIWAAIKGHGLGVNFVDSLTGEVSTYTESNDHELVVDLVDGLSGIPALLSPPKPTKKSSNIGKASK